MNSCLNLDILNELVDIMGDDMEMLINSYIEDSEEKLGQLSNMSLETQQEDIFRMAHSLKGSSRNVGVVSFSDYCEVMENKARKGELTQDDFVMNDVISLFNCAKTELLQRYI